MYIILFHQRSQVKINTSLLSFFLPVIFRANIKRYLCFMLAGPISLKKYWRRFFLYRPQDTTISLPQFAFFSVSFVRGVFA